MERFLGPLNAVDVVVYFDNVLMFALDAGVLIDTIPEVLQLQTVIAGRKCKFFIFEIFIERVHYLWHFTAHGIKEDHIKINRIQQWPC